MSSKYIVNWERDDIRGNVKKAGSTLKITTKPKTPMFTAVILKNYKKVGRQWKGSPVLVAQEKYSGYDGVLSIKLKKYKGKKIINLPKGKYMLKTWIVELKTFRQNMYHDEFEIV